MVSQFNNPFTNPGGFFSSQKGGFFAPPKREGFGGFLSDPRLSFGMAIAQGQPIGQALLGGAIQSQQIEESMFPKSEFIKPFEAYNNETQSNVFVTPEMYTNNPEKYGPKITPVNETKRVTIDDPLDPNYKQDIHVNVSKLNETYIGKDGKKYLKYLADETKVDLGTPFYAYDKKDQKITLIKPELALALPNRYTKVSQKYQDAFAKDADGIFTQEEFRAVGDPMQVYDPNTGKLIDNMTVAEYNYRRQEGIKDPQGEYGNYPKYAITKAGVGKESVLSKTLNANIGETKSSINNQIINTKVLIGKINTLSEYVAENPDAFTVGIGSASSFLQGIGSIIETTGLGKSDMYNKFTSNDKNTTSRQGTEWGSKIEELSNVYAVSQSQIKDLAYVFAAARGQEGRGLSDKDWQNAIDIVSGGVNAEERLNVMSSIVNSVRDELTNKITGIYDLAKLDPDYDKNTLIYYDNVLKQFDTIVPNLTFNNNPAVTNNFVKPNINQVTGGINSFSFDDNPANLF